jgi:predicted acetyltransferase
LSGSWRTSHIARSHSSEREPELSVEIRALRSEEFDSFFGTLHQAFSEVPRTDEIARARRVLPVERALAAFEGDAMVGTTATFPFTLTVPGGELAAGGVTMVGVVPTHRRRGVLRQLMSAQIADSRKHHEPITVLWASEGSIYQRFGYGLATTMAEIDIERERTTFLHDDRRAGTMRLVSTQEALDVLPDVYERVRRLTPGMFVRSREWWDAHTLPDPQEDREGGGPRFIGVWEGPTGIEAYALYRVYSKWHDGAPAGRLEVDEVMALSPVAVREVWSFLFGVDLVARVTGWKEPAEHPLYLMLAEPRRLRLRLQDGMWLRFIDLRSALEGRRYPADGSVVFDLEDDLCPWNQGRWSLESSGGCAQLQATTEPADIALRSEDLAAAYLGGVGLDALERAGRVHEHSAGSVQLAAAMLGWTRRPWCPEIF